VLVFSSFGVGANASVGVGVGLVRVWWLLVRVLVP